MAAYGIHKFLLCSSKSVTAFVEMSWTLQRSELCDKDRTSTAVEKPSCWHWIVRQQAETNSVGWAGKRMSSFTGSTLVDVNRVILCTCSKFVHTTQKVAIQHNQLLASRSELIRTPGHSCCRALCKWDSSITQPARQDHCDHGRNPYFSLFTHQ